jgi:endo-1,3(4)-beta-glucanase
MFELRPNPSLNHSSYYQVRDEDFNDIDNNEGSSEVEHLEKSVVEDADDGFPKVNNQVAVRMVAAALFVIGMLLLLTFSVPLTLQEASSPLAHSVPYTAVDHPEPVSPLWGDVVKPYPTGAFWTNLVVGEGEGAIGVYPYGIKTLSNAVILSYGAFRRVVLKSSITDPFMNDLQVSFVEGVQSHAVETYDNVSVTMTYKANNNIGRMKTHLVKSSPFVTFSFESTTPVISSPLFKILQMDNREYPGSPGKQFILTLGNGQKWLLYSSDPNNALVWDGGDTIKASVPFKGFVRLAYLPVQSFEESFSILMRYVQRYPIGATVSMSYPSVNTAILSIQYITLGSGPLLMLALPHHNSLLPTSVFESEASKEVQSIYFPIYSIKGILKGVVGDCWKLTYNLPTIGWNYVLTDKFTNDQLDEIALSLFTEVKTILPTGTDPYLFGKQMGRMARLALIADNLGIADARQQAIYSLETSIIPWLQSMNHDILHYDRTYGGIVPSYGLADKLQDFGSGWYSDHHFHFGYFAHIVAVLAKLDMPFYEANKPALDAFIRDICNSDSTDSDFPFVRHKDFFDGHSWASGLFQQGNGKGQESSSEVRFADPDQKDHFADDLVIHFQAVNAYYGCALYGVAVGNVEFQRFAQLLVAMEIHSTQKYWHMSNDEIYDSIFASNRMVGNIGALDVTASTWFGSAVEFVHGINM